MRVLLAGLIAGVLLSVMRAPTGLDLMRLPAVDGTTAAVFRALALFLVAAVVGRAARLFQGRGVPVTLFLLGTTLGFALHGLMLTTLWEPESRLGFGVVVVLLTCAAFLVVRDPAPTGQGDPPGEEVGEGEAPRLYEWIGLTTAATGTTLALGCLAYHLRHLGMGQPEDDNVFALVLLAALTVGAQAFGRPLAARGRAPAVLAGGLVVAAASALVGVEILAGLLEPGALDTYLRRFGLDLGMVGTLPYLALLGGAVLVIPGFLAGAALAGARHRVRFSSVVLGAALGSALWPVIVDGRAMEPSSYLELVRGEAPPWSWEIIATGACIAAAGGVLAALGGARGRARLASIGAALAAVALVFVVPRHGVWAFSPWHRVPIEPALVMHTGHGMLTVENARGGARIVTLDRRRMTPLGIEELQDAERIAFAWSLLAPKLRAGGAARVLFVGQMTPARAFCFRGLGELSLDRTVPWHSHAGPIEKALFAAGEGPPGRLIDPGEARRRLARGSYDLVVVPPTYGPVILPKSAATMPWSPAPAPATAALEVPDGTLAVVWLDAAAPISHRDLGRRTILCSRGLDDLNLGIVLGAEPWLAEGALQLHDPGPPARRQWPLAYLMTRPLQRSDRQRSDLLARMSAANADTDAADLFLALALHAAAQRPSSPFETLAQRVELDDDGLEALARAAARAPPDPFARHWWEGLAAVLADKRMPDRVLHFVEPVAQRHGPWPELERVVARAYQEFALPSEAASWLARALESQTHDLGLLLECADWTGRAGDGTGEIELLRRADALQPGRLDVARLLGAALLRAGDDEGRELLEEALAAYPQDEELRQLLEHGPGQRGVVGPPTAGGHEDHDRD